MEVVSSQDIASDNNNNASGEELDKECVKGPVNLKTSKRSPYLLATTVNRVLTEHNADEEEAVTSHVRVGDQYQAVLPAFYPVGQRGSEPGKDRSLQCWSPHPHQDENLEQFIRIAMARYKYSREQAMAMLFWHRHNMFKALQDLPNFAPKPTDWDFEDKLRFEQALQIKGKSFQHIQEILPEKSIASLVEYYYGRTSSSLKNRRRLTLVKKGIAEYGSACGEKSDEYYPCDGGQKVILDGFVEEEEPSTSFSDWEIRNALYERHCEKNHSDLKREQRSSCPICLKKVLNNETENYQSGSAL